MVQSGNRSPDRRRQSLAWLVFVCLAVCLAASAGSACSGDPAAPAADARPAADAGPDGDATVTYRAVGIPGGLDRILITRADPAGDLCAGMRLVWPDSGDGFDIELPAEWGVEFTYLYQGAATCHDDAILPPGAVPASTGSGAITWDDAGGSLPAELSVDVTLTFFSALPWVPDSVDFVVTDLSVL